MKKITVFGGDERMKTVFFTLSDKGYAVDTYGLFESDSADIASSDVFLLPVPATRDGVTEYAPLTSRLIPLSWVINSANDRLCLAGNYDLATERSIDYCRSDAYAVKNAVPTAEGAIALAINNTPFTLWGCNALVTGYGRVGKIMADRLHALGCHVTVSARKPYDFALISSLGMEYIHTNDISRYIDRFDIVFNTLDFQVLNSSLESLRGKTVIDLSTKGGYDPELAMKIGVNAIKAPGLPGRVAPVTAGRILAETVIELIEQN